MSGMPAVSVVIPVYRVEKFLRRCLDSVQNQTIANWEAICVNDGSPDNCGKILAQYAARDPRFKVITKENGGLSDARNVGTAAACGEYVLYLDSDDFIHPQTLEILHSMATHHDADMVSFRLNTKFHADMRRRVARGDDDVRLPDFRYAGYDAQKIRPFITDNILFHSTERNRSLRVRHPVRRHCFPVLGLYRRTLVADTPFIRGIIMEDFPWWSAIMLRHPKTVMINTPLYFYMPNPASILGSSKALRMIESIATGLRATYELYSASASPKELKYFKREFLWPFIIIAMRKVRQLDNGPDIDVARRAFAALKCAGIFDDAPSPRAKKYRRRIEKFIGE